MNKSMLLIDIEIFYSYKDEYTHIIHIYTYEISVRLFVCLLFDTPLTCKGARGPPKLGRGPQISDILMTVGQLISSYL